MKTEIERAPFEAWAKTETARVNLTLAYYPENHSTYKFTRTQHLFEGWLAREAQAPVPPAGDVEVQRYKVNIHVGATTMQRQVVLAKDFDAHVTRLTAERNNVRDLLKELARHPSMSFHQIALVEAIVSEVEKPWSQL